MDAIDVLAVIGVVMLVTFVVGVAAIVWAVRTQKREALATKFGPEYERVLGTYGNQGRAMRELHRRQERVRALHVRLLSPPERDRFGAYWASVQHRFVDDPQGAVADADRLVKDVMATRGYPMEDFEQRVADLSVDHANVVQHYRAARALAAANAVGRASTEDLRQAMVHYRALFADLLQAYEPHARLQEAPV